MEEDFPILLQAIQAAPAPAPQVHTYADNAAPVPEKAAPEVVREPPAPPPKPRRLAKGMMKGSSFQSGLVSVKDMMTQVKEEKTEELSEEELLRNKPRDPFNKEQLLTHWKAYAEQLKDKSRVSLASTLQTCEPELEDNFHLKLMLDNKVQENEINQEKVEILTFLREKLNNYGIQLNPEVRVEVQKKKYYTNRERFDRLAELNPKLQELRQRLNLDPDF